MFDYDDDFAGIEDIFCRDCKRKYEIWIGATYIVDVYDDDNFVCNDCYDKNGYKYCKICDVNYADECNCN